MVNLAQLTQAQSYAQTSGSGFGTRALCRRLTRHGSAPVNMDVWLSGLRRANPFNATTNPVVNAHMRSPGGFVETFPGLRDGGEIGFEANFKNDAPSGVTAVGDITMGDFQAWQAPKETDMLANKSFFHSIFFDREPFEFWVIPPQWTRGLFIARGYASMAGPFPHEMEGVVNFMGSFKISGKPMLLRGELVDMGDAVVPSVADETVRFRAVKDDLLFEAWTNAVAMGDTLAWGDSFTPMSGHKYYKYTEDEGFGAAF